MNLSKSILISALALACFVASADAQVNTLAQTTLSSAVSSATAQTIFVTSATGITVSPATQLYVGFESMLVLGVSGTAITVARGQATTKAVPHISGEIVLVGRPDWFYTVDPVGGCTAASTYVTPYVNMVSGNQWLCSTVMLGWVPGFVNQHPMPIQPTAAVASAAGLITPSGPLFHITGTAAITGFNIPVGFPGGTFCAIPDGAFTTTNANNIAIASTGVVSKQLCWTYDQNTTKFYPTY